MTIRKSNVDMSDNEDDVAWALELEEAIGCAGGLGYCAMPIAGEA